MAGPEQDIEQALTVLRGAFGPGSSDDVLAGAVKACGQVRSWVSAVEARCLGEVRRRRGDAAALVAAEQRATRRQAAAAVRRSKLIDSLPDVGDALASGEITSDHADALTLVPAGHAEALASDAPMLLQHASNVDADAFRDRVRRWKLDQDRATGESELVRPRANRKGSVSTRADDGMGIFGFELDSVTSARVQAALAQRAEKLWRDDNADSAAARRSSAQRLADAFEQMICAGGGESGGVDTSIMIVADLDTLLSGAPGRCELADGTPLPVDEVRQLAVSARLLPAIFDRSGQPLWLGRSARLPNSAQRAVIAARDKGCAVPGCGTPVEWCQIHHILWWSQGGKTDLDNLVTVCSAHHHMIHENGWTISLDTNGTVNWRGPPTEVAA